MKFSKFRFYFQTSQTTALPIPIIISKIIAKLLDKKYQIVEMNNRSITFKWNPFKLVSNFKAPYILDGGNFEITTSENETVVVLNHFINILYMPFLITTLSIILIIQHQYFAILYFVIFFLVAGIFQYTISKDTGKGLLKDILIED